MKIVLKKKNLFKNPLCLSSVESLQSLTGSETFKERSAALNILETSPNPTLNEVQLVQVVSLKCDEQDERFLSGDFHRHPI